jgi:crotonobetainyl-CoA:carnitine CoA-transferase CaiB-like acyl-CoA transferase
VNTQNTPVSRAGRQGLTDYDAITKLAGNPPTAAFTLYGDYNPSSGAFDPLTVFGGPLQHVNAIGYCAINPIPSISIDPNLPVDGSSMVPGPHQPEVQERVKAIFLSRTRAEWEAFGREHDVCLEPVLDPSELAGDAHHVARKAFIDVDSPWGVLKQLRLPTTPRDASFAAPPKLGQHTEEILREAGLRQEEIAAMKAEGAAR